MQAFCSSRRREAGDRDPLRAAGGSRVVSACVNEPLCSNFSRDADAMPTPDLVRGCWRSCWPPSRQHRCNVQHLRWRRRRHADTPGSKSCRRSSGPLTA